MALLWLARSLSLATHGEVTQRWPGLQILGRSRQQWHLSADGDRPVFQFAHCSVL